MIRGVLFVLFIYSPLVFSFGGRSRRRAQPVITPVDTLENPSVMAHSPTGDIIGTPDRANCTPVSITRRASEVSSLVTTMSHVSDHQACQPLNVGQTRVTAGQNLNGVEQNYAVTKTGANEYEASFTMNFQHSNPQVVENMQTKVRNCFSEVRGQGADAQGRILNLKMLTPAEAAAVPEERRPPPVDITIQDNREPNSRNYHSTFDCATIIHETMHLMGLHDEYHNMRRADLVKRNPATGEITETVSWRDLQQMTNEQRSVYTQDLSYERVYQYNHCRSISQVDTLMNNHRGFYPTTLPEYFLCRCENDLCKNKFKALPESVRNTIHKSNFTMSALKNFSDYCTYQDSDLSTVRVNPRTQALQDNQVVSAFSEQDNSFSFTNSRYRFTEPNIELTRTMVVYTCQCPSGNTECEELKNKVKNIADNGAYSQSGSSCVYPSVTVERSFSRESFNNIDPSREFVVTNDAPGRPPFFRNAYVEKILYPSCSSRASKYQSCTQYSYREVGQTCDDKPDYCSTTEWQDEI